MPKYMVRFREVLICEVAVEAATYKEAYEIFKQSLISKTLSLNPDMLGLNYEIESITLGGNHDHQFKRIPDEYQRTDSS